MTGLVLRHMYRSCCCLQLHVFLFAYLVYWAQHLVVQCSSYELTELSQWLWWLFLIFNVTDCDCYTVVIVVIRHVLPAASHLWQCPLAHLLQLHLSLPCQQQPMTFRPQLEAFCRRCLIPGHLYQPVQLSTLELGGLALPRICYMCCYKWYTFCTLTVLNRKSVLKACKNIWTIPAGHIKSVMLSGCD